ncbi:RNA helicase [Sorangium cellulosum]|uniref:DEAD-box ATP-dependent RNA helicase RhpA n=1 Tax=Sorangium cellulosum TaxID=56 RepID=A0A4V0NDH6_SORCE|nr:DEAD/DEAH box helicase [Sorangium cellulosum]AUX22702.1 RNA helicase [Sorangium cellulosum]
MQFTDLDLIEPLLRAIAAEGYSAPTPIQAQAIPPILAGNDVLGCAQTGTGKTAAFALPILQRLAQGVAPSPRALRVLVLTPTRELAAQVGESFETYGRNLGLRSAVVFGGVGQRPQMEALRRGVDVLVATPGRLLDLCAQGLSPFGRLETLVLDEADRMLDMGFIHDIRRVLAMLPERRQTLLFSATMPPDIQKLASSILRRPVRVEVARVATTAENIDQRVVFVERSDKRAMLEHVLKDPGLRRAIVFTRTKHGANRVVQQLGRARIEAVAIHGNKSQGARERALASFKQGTTSVLVATDIAARGIDIEDISHVINYDLPNIPESYVHRIGRTARAGASGVALSFCDSEERAYLADIERLIQKRLPVLTAPGFTSSPADPGPAPQAQARPPMQPQGQGRPQGPGRPHGQGRPQGPGRPHGQGRPQGPGRPQGQGRPQAQGRPQGPGRPQEQAQSRSSMQARPPMQASPGAPRVSR